MTIFVLFLEFTAGELLTPFCRSAFQARIAAESRSYGKNFCNDRVHSSLFTSHLSLFTFHFSLFTFQNHPGSDGNPERTQSAEADARASSGRSPLRPMA
jgi:hypothetical protein